MPFTPDELYRRAFISGDVVTAELLGHIIDDDPTPLKQTVEQQQEELTALKRKIREQEADLFNIQQALRS